MRVGQLVRLRDGAQVAAEDDGGVVEQSTSVGFGHCLQLVEQTGEEFGVSGIALL